MNITKAAFLPVILLLAVGTMAQQQAEQTFPQDKVKAVAASTATSTASSAETKPTVPAKTHEKASVAFQRHVDNAKLHLQHAKQHLKDAKQRLKDANAPAKKPAPTEEDK
jgi:hypothetical protein